MSLVSFAKIRGNTHGSIKQAIAESLDLINYSFGDRVKNVVIKPNLCYYWDYTTGQTTDPKFTAALIDLIRERLPDQPDISIVEADASAMKCTHAFKMLGYEKLSHDKNVRLVNLSEEKGKRVQVTVGSERFRLIVPKTVMNADLKINVPKIKYTPRETKITCAMKNIFGANPYPKKFRYHSRLNEVVVAVNKAMKFDLCLIDGNIVSGNQPRKLGLVMASRDPVAIDVAAAEIAGINPNTLRYIQLAFKEGVGNMSYSPKGLPISYFKERYPQRNFRDRVMGTAYNLLVLTGLDRRIGL